MVEHLDVRWWQLFEISHPGQWHISFLVLSDQTQLTLYLKERGHQSPQPYLQEAHQDISYHQRAADSILLGERMFSCYVDSWRRG